MNVVFHDKPFKLTKENYPLGDTFHVIDNYLSEELHHHWDKTLVRSNLWSKTNQVSSDSKTGLPHHSFWGGTFFRDNLEDQEWCQGNQINRSDTYFARYFNTKRTFSSTLLISLFSVIVYCVWACSQGKEPDLPVISQATRMQL